ncbi:MAG: DUF151 domain-containing protein [Candidatus Aenigmatarchaeota archaeon]
MPKAPLISGILGIFILLVIIAIFVAALNQYFITDGYTKIWPGGILKVSGNTIIFGANCKVITADTTMERALGIADALANTTGDRPDTWMSWLSSLRGFNITVEAVQIQSYDDKFYYSDVLLRGMTDKEKVLRLDMRPSDAIALGLRAGAPIYVNSTLLDDMGEDICEQSQPTA